jgi:hypothetical protein
MTIALFALACAVATFLVVFLTIEVSEWTRARRIARTK